jgi:Ca-activated chloride channel family protein
MMRLLICAVAAASLGLATQQPQQRPVFKGQGDAVRVFATVTDRDGRLVTGLSQSDFEIRDDGKPQPIVQFDNSPQPIRLVLMLDVSGSMAGNLPLLRTASEQLVRRLRPNDVARVGSFGAHVVISPQFTRDIPELLSAIPRDIPEDAPTPLWQALNEAMNTFGDEDDQRRVVLVLSDGKDTGYFDLRHRPSSQADVIDRARDEDVMIYAVGMRSRPRQRPMQRGPIIPGQMPAMMLEDLPDPGLAKVAEETGGGYIEIKGGENMGEAFAEVADELHSQYLIGFVPPKRDGKVHKVDVRVAAKGEKARGRRSYVAPRS